MEKKDATFYPRQGWEDAKRSSEKEVVLSAWQVWEDEDEKTHQLSHLGWFCEKGCPWLHKSDDMLRTVCSCGVVRTYRTSVICRECKVQVETNPRCICGSTLDTSRSYVAYLLDPTSLEYWKKICAESCSRGGFLSWIRKWSTKYPSYSALTAAQTCYADYDAVQQAHRLFLSGFLDEVRLSCLVSLAAKEAEETEDTTEEWTDEDFDPPTLLQGDYGSKRWLFDFFFQVLTVDRDGSKSPGDLENRFIHYLLVASTETRWPACLVSIVVEYIDSRCVCPQSFLKALDLLQ
jgi:hypothetical protein